ncbi:putative ABC transporter [Toxoplasma gondii p89]|uniref:Putative ABC transporter n=1 Tax=Toxoplasma gondii p89 TaxID=943119 RepID=A0A086JEK2_TOXGO|nr:putative ABC transporter [Toxoplasma gondii p89]
MDCGKGDCSSSSAEEKNSLKLSLWPIPYSSLSTSSSAASASRSSSSPSSMLSFAWFSSCLFLPFLGGSASSDEDDLGKAEAFLKALEAERRRAPTAPSLLRALHASKLLYPAYLLGLLRLLEVLLAACLPLLLRSLVAAVEAPLPVGRAFRNSCLPSEAPDAPLFSLHAATACAAAATGASSPWGSVHATALGASLLHPASSQDARDPGVEAWGAATAYPCLLSFFSSPFASFAAEGTDAVEPLAFDAHLCGAEPSLESRVNLVLLLAVSMVVCSLLHVAVGVYLGQRMRRVALEVKVALLAAAFRVTLEPRRRDEVICESKAVRPGRSSGDRGEEDEEDANAKEDRNALEGGEASEGYRVIKRSTSVDHLPFASRGRDAPRERRSGTSSSLSDARTRTRQSSAAASDATETPEVEKASRTTPWRGVLHSEGEETRAAKGSRRAPREAEASERSEEEAKQNPDEQPRKGRATPNRAGRGPATEAKGLHLTTATVDRESAEDEGEAGTDEVSDTPPERIFRHRAWPGAAPSEEIEAQLCDGERSELQSTTRKFECESLHGCTVHASSTVAVLPMASCCPSSSSSSASSSSSSSSASSTSSSSSASSAVSPMPSPSSLAACSPSLASLEVSGLAPCRTLQAPAASFFGSRDLLSARSSLPQSHSLPSPFLRPPLRAAPPATPGARPQETSHSLHARGLEQAAASLPPVPLHARVRGAIESAASHAIRRTMSVVEGLNTTALDVASSAVATAAATAQLVRGDRSRGPAEGRRRRVDARAGRRARGIGEKEPARNAEEDSSCGDFSGVDSDLASSVDERPSSSDSSASWEEDGEVDVELDASAPWESSPSSRSIKADVAELSSSRSSSAAAEELCPSGARLPWRSQVAANALTRFAWRPEVLTSCLRDRRGTERRRSSGDLSAVAAAAAAATLAVFRSPLAFSSRGKEGGEDNKTLNARGEAADLRAQVYTQFGRADGIPGEGTREQQYGERDSEFAPPRFCARESEQSLGDDEEDGGAGARSRGPATLRTAAGVQTPGESARDAESSAPAPSGVCASGDRGNAIHEASSSFVFPLRRCSSAPALPHFLSDLSLFSARQEAPSKAGCNVSRANASRASRWFSGVAFRKDKERTADGSTREPRQEGGASPPKKQRHKRERGPRSGAVPVELTTLLSVDGERIQGGVCTLHEAWATPLTLGITLWLIYVQIPKAFLPGLIVIAVCLLLQILLTRHLRHLTRRLMVCRDARLHACREFFAQFRHVKLLCLERFAYRRLRVLRHHELQRLKWRYYLHAIGSYFFICTPLVVKVVVLFSLVCSHQKLTAASNIFSSLALIDRALNALNSLPVLLAEFTAAAVSFSRFSAFLATHWRAADPVLSLPTGGESPGAWKKRRPPRLTCVREAPAERDERRGRTEERIREALPGKETTTPAGRGRTDAKEGTASSGSWGRTRGRETAAEAAGGLTETAADKQSFRPRDESLVSANTGQTGDRRFSREKAETLHALSSLSGIPTEGTKQMSYSSLSLLLRMAFLDTFRTGGIRAIVLNCSVPPLILLLFLRFVLCFVLFSFSFVIVLCFLLVSFSFVIVLCFLLFSASFVIVLCFLLFSASFVIVLCFLLFSALLSSSSASFSSPPLLSSSSASLSSPSLLASSSASFSSSSSSCFSSSSGAFPASAASAGELTVVVGPSGGGKSSLLCALIGELVLLHGSVAVAGERPKEVLEGSGVFPVHRQGDEMPNPTGRSSEEVEQEKSRDATRNSGLARERSRAGTSSRVARTREEDGAHREVQKERGEAWRNGQEGGEEGGRRGEEPGDEGDREEAEHEQDDAEDSEAMEGIQVGYAAQQPWLFRGTVRENILFGRSFDAGAYHKVLTACALHSDLAKLACKDMTELDSGGQCLSGGQRTRVGLARALYGAALAASASAASSSLSSSSPSAASGSSVVSSSFVSSPPLGLKSRASGGFGGRAEGASDLSVKRLRVGRSAAGGRPLQRAERRTTGKAKPAFLFLIDDPFSSLDAVTATWIWRHVFADGGILSGQSVVLVTHAAFLNTVRDPPISSLLYMEGGYLAPLLSTTRAPFLPSSLCATRTSRDPQMSGGSSPRSLSPSFSPSSQEATRSRGLQASSAGVEKKPAEAGEARLCLQKDASEACGGFALPDWRAGTPEKERGTGGGRVCRAWNDDLDGSSDATPDCQKKGCKIPEKDKRDEEEQSDDSRVKQQVRRVFEAQDPNTSEATKSLPSPITKTDVDNARQSRQSCQSPPTRSPTSLVVEANMPDSSDAFLRCRPVAAGGVSMKTTQSLPSSSSLQHELSTAASAVAWPCAEDFTSTSEGRSSSYGSLVANPPARAPGGASAETRGDERARGRILLRLKESTEPRAEGDVSSSCEVCGQGEQVKTPFYHREKSGAALGYAGRKGVTGGRVDACRSAGPGDERRLALQSELEKRLSVSAVSLGRGGVPRTGVETLRGKPSGKEKEKSREGDAFDRTLWGVYIRAAGARRVVGVLLACMLHAYGSAFCDYWVKCWTTNRLPFLLPRPWETLFSSFVSSASVAEPGNSLLTSLRSALCALPSLGVSSGAFSSGAWKPACDSGDFSAEGGHTWKDVSFLFVYFVVACVSILLCVCTTFGYVRCGLSAAQALHERMLAALLRYRKRLVKNDGL